MQRRIGKLRQRALGVDILREDKAELTPHRIRTLRAVEIFLWRQYAGARRWQRQGERDRVLEVAFHLSVGASAS